jgi:major tropism determinant Mtd-like protein
MPKQVRLRRGTTAQHSAFTGAEGELTYDTDKKTVVIHDGVTQGGRPQDRYLQKVPATMLTQQTVSGPVTFNGGDSETYGLAVINQTTVNQCIVNQDLQVKRYMGQQQALAYAASVNLDFDSPTGFGEKRITLAGNLTLTTSNIKIGMHMDVFIFCDGSLRTLTFPGGWNFVGATAPANIPANKKAWLHLRSTGVTDNDVWARWLVQP